MKRIYQENQESYKEDNPRRSPIFSVVIDPKVPLSPKGRGDLIISPPLRGGDRGEGAL
jgi:hypothetical protein